MLNLREGDKVTRIPALQAVLRSQIALAAKGNGPAQRAVVKTVQEIEAEVRAHGASVTATTKPSKDLNDVTVTGANFWAEGESRPRKYDSNWGWQRASLIRWTVCRRRT